MILNTSIGEVEVSVITGKTAKALSRLNRPSIQEVVSTITDKDVEECGNMTFLDALKVIILTWNITHNKSIYIKKKHCSCGQLNHIKFDVNVDKIKNMKQSEAKVMDICDEKLTINPPKVSSLNAIDESTTQIEYIEILSGINLDDYTLPQINLIAEAVMIFEKDISDFLSESAKCKCGKEVVDSISLNENFLA
jgi:hypothetical protein